MSTIFADLRKAVIAKAFPDGEAENLTKQHRDDLVAGLIDIQQFDSFYQQRHIDVFPFCSTLFYCGATVLEKPRGKVIRIYTLPEETDCCPVVYEWEDNSHIFWDWLDASRPLWKKIVQPGAPPLPMGFHHADPITDKGCRYNWGRYCLDSDYIFIGHRIESTERVVIEWSGIKRRFADNDIIKLSSIHDEQNDKDEGVELVDVLAVYVKAQHLMLYEDDMQAGAAMMQLYTKKRADLIYRHKMEMRPEARPVYVNFKPRPNVFGIFPPGSDYEVCRTAPQVKTDATWTYAFVADIDGEKEEAASVANLIAGWGPAFVIGGGDIWNNKGDSTKTQLDITFGRLYRMFLYPYRGSAGPQVAQYQRFYSAIGNHDRDPAVRFDLVREFLNMPPSTIGGISQPNKGYYDILLGNVHWFFIDSGFMNDGSTIAQEDGITETSPQGRYMLDLIRKSNAPWKIVVLHHPPYASIGDGHNDDYAALRWDFKGAGVNLVLSGHKHWYERCVIDGLPYLVCGLGGAPILSPSESELATGSQVRYNAKHGALLIAATATQLRVFFLNIDSELIDGIQFDKEACTWSSGVAPVTVSQGGSFTPPAPNAQGQIWIGTNTYFDSAGNLWIKTPAGFKKFTGISVDGVIAPTLTD